MRLKWSILFSPCPSVRPSICSSAWLSVHLSVMSICGWNRVSSVSSTVLTGSNIYIYVYYQATSEGVLHVNFFAKFQDLKFWQIFQTCWLCLVSTWDRIWINWVIMGWHGVFLEWRHSSCSSSSLTQVMVYQKPLKATEIGKKTNIRCNDISGPFY